MKYGMNLLLWTGDVGAEHLALCEELKEIGFDGVELPIFAADEKKFAKIGNALGEIGLECTAVTVRNEDDNPIDASPAIRASAIEATMAALDSCAAAGAETLCGPYHSALGLFSGAGPTDDEWRRGVDAMRPVAEHAASVGVTLAIECLNRFENYLLNTHADAARFAGEVDHPSCKIMYDTFHAHIEEKSVTQAIENAGDAIAHVHISENDRSTPGMGQIRWDETFDGLRSIGYDGWLVVEAFGLALPELAAATKIWRRMFDDEMELAANSLSFMQAEIAKRW